MNNVSFSALAHCILKECLSHHQTPVYIQSPGHPMPSLSPTYTLKFATIVALKEKISLTQL